MNNGICGGSAGLISTGKQLLLDIFPNPTGNSANIILSNLENKDYRLVLVNILGENAVDLYINKTNKITNEINLDLTFMPSGIYQCRIISSSGIEASVMMVISK